MPQWMKLITKEIADILLISRLYKESLQIIKQQPIQQKNGQKMRPDNSYSSIYQKMYEKIDNLTGHQGKANNKQ